MSNKINIALFITISLLSSLSSAYGMYNKKNNQVIESSSEESTWSSSISAYVYDTGSFLVNGIINNGSSFSEKGIRTLKTSTDINFLMAKTGALPNNEVATHPEVQKTLLIYNYMLPKIGTNNLTDSTEDLAKEAQFTRRISHVANVAAYLLKLEKKTENKERTSNFLKISGELIPNVYIKGLQEYINQCDKETSSKVDNLNNLLESSKLHKTEKK